jgi:hypothetical protein
MSAQQAEDGGATVMPKVTAAEEREIVRRANQLCRRAEPHTESAPCPAHLHEAQRQLFGPTA